MSGNKTEPLAHPLSSSAGLLSLKLLRHEHASDSTSHLDAVTDDVTNQTQIQRVHVSYN